MRTIRSSIVFSTRGRPTDCRQADPSNLRATSLRNQRRPNLCYYEKPVSHAGYSWYGLSMEIDRKADIALVRTDLRRSRAVAILGPRQCGKTTLARHFVSPDSLNYFDLEEPQSLARLA